MLNEENRLCPFGKNRGIRLLPHLTTSAHISFFNNHDDFEIVYVYHIENKEVERYNLYYYFF